MDAVTMVTVKTEGEGSRQLVQHEFPQQENQGKWKGLSSTLLKTIAIVTMLIDHIGAAVVSRMLSARGIMAVMATNNPQIIQAWFTVGDNYRVYVIYELLRGIGRIAFPIFCFMLVEGFGHTRNVWKYALRLGIFALASEIPFDLAFMGKVLEFNYQNVFFTLLIGLLTMIALEKIGGKAWSIPGSVKNDIIKVSLTLAVAALGMGFAVLLRTDYGGSGVACILIMYFLRKKRWLELLAGYLSFVILLGEVVALPAFLALALYRGKKGTGWKYFFYGFYPVHLLLLYLTCVLMGIAAYPAL